MVALAGRDCSTLIWPRLGSGSGLLAVVAGGAGEVAGEGAAVGALGLELGFGTLGAGPFGLGERVCRGELGLVVLAEGVAFAGSVGAELGCLVAGVGLGLAGAADLGVGGVPGLRSGGDRVVALAGAVAGGNACGGCFLVGAGLDGGDLRAGVAAQLGELGGCGARGRPRLPGRRPARRRCRCGPQPGPRRVHLFPGGLRRLARRR